MFSALVCLARLLTLFLFNRLHLFLKDKTSSSVTNCASLLPSTERSEMTRTKPARTAVASATASMTALISPTTRPASSVVFAVTLATWLETVPTDRRVLAGVTMADMAVVAVVVEAMPSTENMRYV